MNALMRGAFRFGIVIVLGLLTFWPTYGLLWLAIANFPQMPEIVLVLGAVWMIILSIVLPLSLKQFRWVSSVLLAGVIAVGIWQGQKIGLFTIASSDFLFTWGIAAVFAIVGWLLVATPIWRSTRGIVAVEDQHH